MNCLFFNVRVKQRRHFVDRVHVAALTNLALGKQTWQSSTYQIRTSNLAVDGNANPNILTNPVTCITTNSGDFNTWWAVDLGTAYTVQGVLMTNVANGYGKTEGLEKHIIMETDQSTSILRTRDTPAIFLASKHCSHAAHFDCRIDF